MKILLLAAILGMVSCRKAPVTTGYRVVPIDKREVVVVCPAGVQPLISQSGSEPNLVSIKCLQP